MTYIVHDTNSATVCICETARLAAGEILTYDGFKYEIREVEGDFILYRSNRSQHAGGGYTLKPTVVFSVKSDRDAAEREIFDEVVKRANDFTQGVLEVYEREHFIELCREQIADASKPSKYGIDDDTIKRWSDILTQCA